MLTLLKKFLVVCSSSMVFLLLELQLELHTFPYAILLKKVVLIFYAQYENKVLSSHLLSVFSFILTD